MCEEPATGCATMSYLPSLKRLELMLSTAAARPQRVADCNDSAHRPRSGRRDGKFLHRAHVAAQVNRPRKRLHPYAPLFKHRARASAASTAALILASSSAPASLCAFAMPAPTSNTATASSTQTSGSTQANHGNNYAAWPAPIFARRSSRRERPDANRPSNAALRKPLYTFPGVGGG